MTAPDLDALDARLTELHELAWRSPKGLEKAIATGIVQELVTTGRSLIAEVRELTRQRDEARAALDDIRLGAQVMDPVGCSIAVREFITSTKLRTLSALPPPAGSETGER